MFKKRNAKKQCLKVWLSLQKRQHSSMRITFVHGGIISRKCLMQSKRCINPDAGTPV